MTNASSTQHAGEQTERRRGHFWGAWGMAYLASMILIGLATLPPFVGATLQEVLMQAFAPLCHQMPSRSPHWQGIPLAVCDRCYGIYWGLLLAAVAFLFLRRWDRTLYRYAGPLLVLSLTPLGIDWAVEMLGWWHNTPISRFATGLFFGVTGGLLFVRAVVAAGTKAKDKRTSERA